MTSGTSAPSPIAVAVDRQVWRVGFLPDPWAWPSWQYSTDGRFGGRWDDRDGNFRTIYAGADLLGCLLEVLACFRSDLTLAADLAGIEDNDPQAPRTAGPGCVPRSWLTPRSAASARLSGTYCAVTQSETIAALRPVFAAHATALGLADFDAGALKDARPRELTQAVATYLYETTDLAGIQFLSRHGDERQLWALFERPGDGEVSPRLSDPAAVAMTEHSPEILEAFRLHGLAWADER
jgi:hypothetical protein